VTARQWINRNVVGVGEAMLEFAPVGDDVYRRGFAGDTLNTCWHLAELIGENGSVGYLTGVGTDPWSDAFVAFLEGGGLEASRVFRDPTRTIGLYVISLAGAERRFSYWRDMSAARLLADDPVRLAAALRDVGLIHVSGITLAIIDEDGRRNLLDALGRARSEGAVVSFDPNARLRVWRDEAALRRATREMMDAADILLPSFEDERRFWGDATPEATLTRMEGYGVQEIAVKNGADPVVFSFDGVRGEAPTPKVETIRDTTGAGDAFNAGYLAARLTGKSPLDSCTLGQQVATEVIGHFGALAPKGALGPSREEIDRRRAIE
jgi:2-dehydro-3-deoxygluconokinase